MTEDIPYIEYQTEKHFLVKGNTQGHRSIFTKYGGTWLPSLKAWQFSATREPAVKGYLEDRLGREVEVYDIVPQKTEEAPASRRTTTITTTRATPSRGTASVVPAVVGGGTTTGQTPVGRSTTRTTAPEPTQAEELPYAPVFYDGNNVIFQVGIYTFPLPVVRNHVKLTVSRPEGDEESVWEIVRVTDKFPRDSADISYRGEGEPATYTIKMTGGEFQVFCIDEPHTITFLDH